MNYELAASDYQKLWKRLQQIGLNAYEARTYLVLIGHPRFKALEVAARAHVPRQKIYEVLDSLVKQGFARVIRQKTKLFSAVEPALALPTYVARLRRHAEQELTEQARLASALMEDLATAYSEGQDERGTLDFLTIISEPAQSAVRYRRMLTDATTDYMEFLRPPYAIDPLEDSLICAACRRGLACRILIDPSTLDERRLRRFQELKGVGIQVRRADPLPMKLALFDGRRGLIALLDPVVTKPTWTTLMFDHAGLGEAMRYLFEEHWKASEPF